MLADGEYESPAPPFRTPPLAASYQPAKVWFAYVGVGSVTDPPPLNAAQLAPLSAPLPGS